MIDQTEARARAAKWLREHGQGGNVDEMLVEAFEDGWLVNFRVPEPKSGRMPPLGGMRLIVDKDDGAVHAFPTNRPPTWTAREYSERKHAQS